MAITEATVKAARESTLLENKKVLCCCVLIAVANAFYGFDTASIGGLQAMPGFLAVYGYSDPKSAIGYSITTRVQQLIASLLTVGSIVGCLTTGIFASKFGRRPALWFGCVIAAIANGVQAGTTTLGGLYAGRIILGFSNAYFIIFSNVFISEIAPHHLRAILISFFGFWVSIGTILGNVVDFLTKGMTSKLSYRIPIACNYFFLLILAIGLIFIPESPRWLMLHGRSDAASRALTWYRGNSLSSVVLEELVEIERGIAEEKELSKGVSVLDLFRGPNLLRSIICWASVASHAATGVFVLISFNTFFFQQAGIQNPFQLSITSTVMGWVGVIIGMYLMFKVFGRRIMMMGGAFFNSLFMLALAITWTIAPTGVPGGKALTAFAMLFNVSYNGGIGSVSYAVATEVVSSRLRSYSMGIATGWNYLFNWVITFTAPYFINPTSSTYIGVKYCYIWASSNFLVLVFFFFFIPEMKGLTLEEIDECFENRVPIRKFKDYRATSAIRAAEIVTGEKGVAAVDIQENARVVIR